MKSRKKTTLIMLLGLLLVAFAAVIAQTPSQGEQKAKADSCCSMESCCCNSDSCQTMMKADGTAVAGATANTDAKPDCCNGDSCKMKKKDMNHTGDHECCGCCADSCEMDMKADGAMKHDMKDMKHDMKDHKGDCCKAKAKDAKDKNKQ